MKRSEIKRRPLSDTALAGLEPDANEYRELDGSGLYFRVKPDGQKSWQLRYKKPDGKCSWLGLGGYPEVRGSVARQKAAELRTDAADGKNPIVTKQARKKAERDIAGERAVRLTSHQLRCGYRQANHRCPGASRLPGVR